MSVDTPPSNPLFSGCLAGILDRGDRCALIQSDGDRWTYREVVEALNSGKAMNCRGRTGVLVSDRLLSGLASCAVMTGGSCVPLDPKMALPELQERICYLGIKTLVVDSDRWSGLEVESQVRVSSEGHVLQWEGEVVEADATEAALVLMTSGSTGKPKIVPLSHDNLCHSTRSIADSMALGENDRAVNLLPMSHIGGLVDLFLVPLLTGGSVIFAEPDETGMILALLERERATWLQGAPAILQSLYRFASVE